MCSGHYGMRLGEFTDVVKSDVEIVTERNEDRERSPRGIALTLAAVEHDQKITVAFDTGAAVTTIPESLAEGVRDDGNNQKFRTASGELIVDKGSTCLLGQDERYNNKAIRGRVTEVRKTLPRPLVGNDRNESPS